MITYWAPRAGAFTIREYVQQRGAPIAQHFTTREYEQLTSILTVGGPAHIFAAGCQLSPAATELVGHIIDAIATVAPEWRLLNDPRKTLRRKEFLAAMATTGLNSFHVYEARFEDPSIRYPVFLRERNRHDGPLTGLLHSPSEVRAALRALRLRGHHEQRHGRICN